MRDLTAGRADASPPLPLAAGQEALWFIHRIAPDSAAYNVTLGVRVRTQLDPDRLELAVAAVRERHDLLRSTFGEVDGRPVRFVNPATLASSGGSGRPAPADFSSLSFSVFSVRDLSPTKSDTQWYELARDAGAVPFRLLAGEEPFRVTLLRRALDDGLLVVSAHHLVVDGPSMPIIFRDLLRAYQMLSEAGDHPSPLLAPLPRCYDDYVRMERKLIESERGERQAGYWREVCAGSSPARLLPDRPQPPRRRYAGETCPLRVPKDLTSRLRSTSVTLGVTSFAVVLGALQSLLYRWTGQPDSLIGTAALVRYLPGLRDVVGYMVNPLPLRGRFTESTTIAEAIESANNQVRAGMANVGYPFHLVSGAVPGAASGALREDASEIASGAENPVSASRKPQLFRILLTQLSIDLMEPPLPMPAAGETVGAEIEYEGFRLSFVDLPQQEGQFDLTIDLRQSAGGVTGALRYDSDLFERSTIERFADQFHKVLDLALTTPGTRVLDISLIDDLELSQLLAFGEG